MAKERSQQDRLQQARERVLASFSYDADSGEIVRTAKGGGSSVVGAIATQRDANGYKPFGGRAHIGVSFDARKRKWKAEIMHLGRHKFLGYRATPDEAYKLYLAAKPLIHEGTVV